MLFRSKKFTQIRFNEERRARNDSVGEPIIEIRKRAIEIFNDMFAEKSSEGEETANANGVTHEICPCTRSMLLLCWLTFQA